TWTFLAVLLWKWHVHVPHLLVVAGLLVCALRKRPQGSPAWRCPAGIAFLLLAVFMLVSLPLSQAPILSLRTFGPLIPIVAGAFAIPVVFDTRERVVSALVASAAAITLILAADLVRLAWLLRSSLLTEARWVHPYVLNHPNVASLLASGAALLLVCAAWENRRRPARLAACCLGVTVNMVYVFVLASRGPQIAFAAAVCAFGILLPGWKSRIAWFAILAVAAVVLVANIERVNRRFTQADTGSFNERQAVWTHTWKLAQHRPIVGHGYGKMVFEEVYYSSNPPHSSHRFPHAHQYWLKVLFESGWIGVTLHAVAWGLLAARLLAAIFRHRSFTDRLAPGVVALVLLMMHVYGAGDWPDEAARIAQVWLIPVALVLTQREKPVSVP
ncbi:MAG: O-antigen ligase family protein, partial [Lentisphaerae bacterium]|nr:O-antigen ligase family protein [Lentisphaerota bacterium]